MKRKNEISKILMLALIHIISDLRNINWQEALEINRKETNVSFIKFFDIFELLLGLRGPLKKLSCSEAKFYLKPWITPGIRKCMKVKDRLQKKSLRAKNPIQKDALHNEVKQYQNYINILTRNSKANPEPLFRTKDFSKITK